MSNYRIAIVGPREAIAGFALLGVDIMPAYSAHEAVEVMLKLKKTMATDNTGREHNAYGIVFITEDLAGGISQEDNKKLSRGALPAIIPLPSHRGASGFGLERLKRIVERAIGSNILQ